MASIKSVNYTVRFFVRTDFGVTSFKEDFGENLPRAREVQQMLKRLLPPEQHKFIALVRNVITQEYTSLGG